MWDLEVKSQGSQYVWLMDMHTEAIIGVLVLLLVVRYLIQSVLSVYFRVRAPKPEHSQSALEYSYFYHLSIIILILSDANWNVMDLLLWVFSYVCIGMLRNAIHVAKIQNNLILNDVAYNSNLLTMLWGSKIYGLALLVFSVSYFIWVMYCFTGIPFRMTSLLLFPTLMLAFDSAFMFLGSLATQKQIHCYYNPNISQIPEGYKIDVYHKICGSAVRMWHYYSLIRLFLRSFLQKFQFLDCMWILSVLNACYLSTGSLVKSLSEYSSWRKLVKKINTVFRRQKSKPGQICIICMQQLLNCREISSCGHSFHYKCLFQWLQTKSECPICRINIHLD